MTTPAQPPSKIQVERAAGVLVVRLDRPAARNALDLELTTALADALTVDDDVRAVALLARGETFCVGGDVRLMAEAPEPERFVRDLAEELHRAIRAVASGPPVVVGVRGWVAGAGLGLVLAADSVIAGQSTMLRPAYPGIGVTPDGGLTWSLPRALGDRKARGWLLENTTMTGSEALQFGLVDELVPDDEVEDVVFARARRLAAGPRAALVATKALLHGASTRSLSEQLDAEAESIAAHAATSAGREGIRAFAERRPPVFG